MNIKRRNEGNTNNNEDSKNIFRTQFQSGKWTHKANKIAKRKPPKLEEKFQTFSFKRSKNTIYYHEPLPLETDEESNPWSEMLDQGYALTTIRKPDRCLGFTRRRMGRGGRIIIDRAYHKLNPQLKKLDLDPTVDHLPVTNELTELYNSIRSEEWPHYHHVENSSDDSSEFMV